MPQTTTAPPGRHWLLLCADPAWPPAVQRELTRSGGGELDVAHSPQDALDRLARPAHPFSHLLLEPAAAGSYMRDLVGVSAGEKGSRVELLLLGDPDGLSGQASLRKARTPADLVRALGLVQDTTPPPALSASEIAISFDPRQLQCRFQPIVRLRDRRPVGMETLVRLEHPYRGTVGPDQFIPQVERSGLSLRLTEAVAARALSEIEPALLEEFDLYITINLPLDVLMFPEALVRIERHRAASGIPVSRVLIELTESRPVQDLPSVAIAVERWRQAGYRVAIDDMGPEMMNQLELFELPFNVIKLDKQIVLRSEKDQLARRYLHRTVENARLRGLSVIAEGIENEAMWTRMLEMGVEHAQGFLIARALPASALRAWIEAWSSQSSLPPDQPPSPG